MRKKSAGPMGNDQGNDQGNQRVQLILRIAIAAALGDKVTLQPNLHVVFNPSDTGSVPDALVLGMQMSLLF